MTGRLLTTRELADHLGLSPETVLRRWRRGEIPGGIRLASNVLRFRETTIDEWLTGLEHAAGAQESALTSVPAEEYRGERRD